MDAAALRAGMNGLQLMENAASGLYQAALEMLESHSGPVCVVCGSGNNGGDGYACARMLNGAGVPVIIIASGEPRSVDCVHNHAVCRAMGLPIVPYAPGVFDGCALIVDALLGTGFSPPLSAEARRLIGAMNASGKPILAADLPSGMDGLTGQGDCVRAQTTVTFGAMKLGLALKQEPAGRVLIAGIGFPPPEHSGYTLADDTLVSAWLPRRAPDAHKGSQGHVLALAGSIGMAGAAVFAASAAQRTGAGLVTMAVTRELYPIYASAVPEALFHMLGEQPLDVARYDAVVIGPGLSQSPEAAALVRAALDAPLPQIWDADALNLVASGGISYPTVCVITPHPGEMARLCDVAVNAVQADRAGIAKQYADAKRVIVVLKGHRTVIAVPDGEVYVNPTGSPAMASAGMGDALAGMIGALLAQGLSPEQAAVCGVYWHGLAGQRLTEGMTVTDLIRAIPETRIS
jgi:NAD(P)H-hydrate epimerase